MLVLTSQLSFAKGGIEVVSDNPLQLPASEAAYSPVISPDGEWLLVASNAMKGLQKYDLATGQLKTITTDNGAGYNAKISNDGSTIVYRTSEFKNRLRYFSAVDTELVPTESEDQVDLKRGLLILHRVRRIPASADGGSLVQLGGFPGLPVFVCCQVLGNTAKPGEFAGPLRKGLFGGHSPVERVLRDLFRQRLIPHQGHHIRIDLQIVGLI